MAFLGGLALLGSAGEAYQSAKSKQQALDAADLDQQASVLLGQGMGQLAQLQGIQGPGGLPPLGGDGSPQQPAPPQPSPPSGGAPPAGPMMGQAQPLSGGTLGPPGPGGVPSFDQRFAGGPAAPQFGDPTSVRTTPQAGGGAQPFAMPRMGGGGQPQQPQQPPTGAGGGPPGGQPQQRSMTPGMMDLPTLAGLIKSANPNAKPEVFAKALEKGAHLLAPFAQQQLREAMIQMQYHRLEAIHPGWQQFQDWVANNPEAARDPQQLGDAFNLFTGKSQLIQERGAQVSEHITQRGQQASELETKREGGRERLLGQRGEQETEHIAQRGEEQRKTQAAKPQKTPAAVEKEKQHQTAVKHLIDQIDTATKAIDTSLAGGAPVTGIGGTAERFKEFGAGVGEQFGFGTGGGETPASNFETQVRIIQQLWPRVLSGSKVTNKQERDHADQVIRGLGTFTSPQQAKNGLNEAKNVLQKFLEDEPGSSDVKLPPGVKSIKVVE